MTRLKIGHPWIQTMLGPASLAAASPETREKLLRGLESSTPSQYRVAWGISSDPEPWFWVTSNLPDGAKFEIRALSAKDQVESDQPVSRVFAVQMKSGYAEARLSGLPRGAYWVQLVEDPASPPARAIDSRDSVAGGLKAMRRVIIGDPQDPKIAELIRPKVKPSPSPAPGSPSS